MGVHATCGSQPDSGRTSTTEQAVVQEPAPTTAMRSPSSLSPSFLPSSSLHSSNFPIGQQSHTYGTSHSHEVRPSRQVASSSAQSLHDTSRQWQHPRYTTPVPRQGPSTSHSVLQTGVGPSSIDFTTSTFSFRVPSQTNYPVSRVSRNHHDLLPVTTGYPSGGRSSTASTQLSTQTSAQVNLIPPQPST